MGRKPPERPSHAVDTVVVELPIFDEAELQELAQRSQDALRAISELRAEVRKILARVQQVMRNYEGAMPPPRPAPRLRVHSGGADSGLQRKRRGGI